MIIQFFLQIFLSTQSYKNNFRGIKGRLNYLSKFISNENIKWTSKSEIIKSLAFCSGHTGIAGGQELDLKFENKKKI